MQARICVLALSLNIFVHKNDLPDSLFDDAKSVAVDTETMGLLPHRDRLCLAQFSSGNGDCHLVQFDDFLCEKPVGKPSEKACAKTAQNIKNLLKNSCILKIFHYARFDVMMLYKYLGVMTTNLYCTKVSSKLARTYTSKHSLFDLCFELLNIEISKEQTCSDWGRAELTEKQKHYAATDVLHLHKIKDKLDEILARENRQILAKNCFEFLETRVILDLIAGQDYDIFSHCA
ncbi:3'-5' exonuclease [Alphaproteobacteria bacterium]|nr:3'-5' exonuclease [Alphaproteobacteria bacterium]